jgi:polyphosphate kinase
MQEHISDLLGMKATGCHQFRVTRNADLTVSEDVEDLAIASKVNFRQGVLDVQLDLKSIKTVLAILLIIYWNNLNWKDRLYFVDGPVNLARFISNFDLPDLRFQPYQQKIPKALYSKKPIFDVKAGMCCYIIHLIVLSL